jgi:hypothetical protein
MTLHRIMASKASRAAAGIAMALAATLATATVGQSPAGEEASRVTPWSPDGISSPMFESHPAFDPRTGDLYFVRSTPEFRGWRIYFSHCTGHGWSKPEPPPFAGDGVEADPWFDASGRLLYFISTRSTDGIERDDLDLWRVDRDDDGKWGEPVRLPAPLNSTGKEWFPRLAADGWLYFGSDRAGGFGKTDIWRGRRAPDGSWQVENAGAALNSAGDEYEAQPSPDGGFLVLMTGDGLYRSDFANGAWQPRVRLPDTINANGSEVGALLSPSGHSMLFARDAGKETSGELFLWRLQGTEDWPPECPRSVRDGDGKARDGR